MRVPSLDGVWHPPHDAYHVAEQYYSIEKVMT